MTISREKWFAMSRKTRLGHIAVELKRAERALASFEEDKVTGAYERILDMLDATLEDKEWEDKANIFALRDAVATLYVNENHSAINRYLAKSLLKEAELMS